MSLEKGKCYMIKFLDHSIGEGILVTKVCGWIHSQSEKEVLINYWYVEEEDHRENNVELISLVREAILEFHLIG